MLFPSDMKLSSLLFTSVFIASGVAQATNSANLVHELRQAKDRTRIDLTRYEKDIDEQIKSVMNINTRDVLGGQSDQVLTRIKETVDNNLAQKNEARLRGEFWDQLIYRVASHYSSGSAKDFFNISFLELARTELGSGTNKSEVTSEYWFFLLNLHVALKTMSEKIEDPIRFIESYLNYSTISNPKPVSGFRSNDTSYLNETSQESLRAKKTTTDEE